MSLKKEKTEVKPITPKPKPNPNYDAEAEEWFSAVNASDDFKSEVDRSNDQATWSRVQN
jgi:hypothetical protein